MSHHVTRLAPSPTGALHLGNARTFLVNWVLARQNDWRIVLRVEDLDSPRVKAGADRGAIADLTWLGMDWDDGPYYQATDLEPYEAALATLRDAGLTYPCVCTRREIEQAQSAPHGDEHELRYPGKCRPADAHDWKPPADAEYAVRVRTPDEPVRFTDKFAGPQASSVQQVVGAFIVASKAKLPAYQLAVVVDDARQGVTDVVRGDDLIRSTARQILLYRMLKLDTTPDWWHLPLVIGEDGRRLAKRHGDTRIAWYREQGVASERVIGLLAHWSGAAARREPMSARQLVDRFDISRLAHEPVTFSAEDHAWLLDE